MACSRYAESNRPACLFRPPVSATFLVASLSQSFSWRVGWPSTRTYTLTHVLQTPFTHVQTLKQVERVATPSRVFYAENAFILPFWLGMIVWPEEKSTKQVMSSYLPVIAAAIVYTWLTYECFQNPVSLQGACVGTR